jgi:hypothetical protein
MIVSASPIAETIAITVPITINGQAKGGMQLIGGASPEVMVGSVLMHPCNGPLTISRIPAKSPIADRSLRWAIEVK